MDNNGKSASLCYGFLMNNSICDSWTRRVDVAQIDTYPRCAEKYQLSNPRDWEIYVSIVKQL